MAFLFQKFQEVVKVLAKSSTFARDPKMLQFEADINRLFLYTSYNRLGENANETDAEEIIELASKATFADQQKQVQENIHYQVKTFCTSMDEILVPNFKNTHVVLGSDSDENGTHCSDVSFAVDKNGQPPNRPAVPETKSSSRAELSQWLKDHIGCNLDIKSSQIPHKDAGQGLFIAGEADVGSVVAFYPGVIYLPAYYQYIPGYPMVDTNNPYLITRHDGITINAQPWGTGREARELWNGSTMRDAGSNVPVGDTCGEVLELRNPLALGHFANHPGKGMEPNAMVCPYDFPLNEAEMRAYIPNILFSSEEPAKVKSFSNFWSKTGGSDDVSDIPLLRTVVLVATRALRDEEVLLNYRLSNSKPQPTWYTPVDEEEDQHR